MGIWCILLTIRAKRSVHCKDGHHCLEDYCSFQHNNIFVLVKLFLLIKISFLQWAANVYCGSSVLFVEKLRLWLFCTFMAFFVAYQEILLRTWNTIVIISVFQKKKWFEFVKLTLNESMWIYYHRTKSGRCYVLKSYNYGSYSWKSNNFNLPLFQE